MDCDCQVACHLVVASYLTGSLVKVCWFWKEQMTTHANTGTLVFTFVYAARSASAETLMIQIFAMLSQHLIVTLLQPLQCVRAPKTILMRLSQSL